MNDFFLLVNKFQFKILSKSTIKSTKLIILKINAGIARISESQKESIFMLHVDSMKREF